MRSAFTAHDVLPTHAFSTIAIVAFASHVGSCVSPPGDPLVGQWPLGVPKEAKAIPVIGFPPGHARGRTWFSPTIPQGTGDVGGGAGGDGGAATGLITATATADTAIGGSILACSAATWTAVGGVAAAGDQDDLGNGLNPTVFQPNGSARASMYSMNPVPADPPCFAFPGLRCTSPLNDSGYEEGRKGGREEAEGESILLIEKYCMVGTRHH